MHHLPGGDERTRGRTVARYSCRPVGARPTSAGSAHAIRSAAPPITIAGRGSGTRQLHSLPVFAILELELLDPSLKIGVLPRLLNEIAERVPLALRELHAHLA